jgi:hypothetical protein
MNMLSFKQKHFSKFRENIIKILVYEKIIHCMKV